MGSYLFPTLLIIIVSLKQSAGRCGHGRVEYGGKCYWFVKEPKTFFDALMVAYRARCQLLELQNKKEQWWLDLYLRLQGMNSVWLGFTDIQKEGHWIALSNRTKMTYSSWKRGEPNNAGGKEHCAVYTTDALGWIDYNCTGKLQFVCKY